MYSEVTKRVVALMLGQLMQFISLLIHTHSLAEFDVCGYLQWRSSAADAVLVFYVTC